RSRLVCESSTQREPYDRLDAAVGRPTRGRLRYIMHRIRPCILSVVEANGIAMRFRPLVSVLFSLFLLAAGLRVASALAQETPDSLALPIAGAGPIYVVPVEGKIGRASWRGRVYARE